ncbi:MAG: SufD family Fe-S cluster assembly protein, partial [Candidatus Eremiobacteraeota bacterium]|nr:SufD family Fe-S cluster assembly protein [Candidatus Eremiobacteraeota bacterium]
IDEDEVFYAMTRGIGREEAERMIALGFFEPALARFPGEALRDELRRSLAEKIA